MADNVETPESSKLLTALFRRIDIHIRQVVRKALEEAFAASQAAGGTSTSDDAAADQPDQPAARTIALPRALIDADGQIWHYRSGDGWTQIDIAAPPESSEPSVAFAFAAGKSTFDNGAAGSRYNLHNPVAVTVQLDSEAIAATFAARSQPPAPEPEPAIKNGDVFQSPAPEPEPSYTVVTVHFRDGSESSYRVEPAVQQQIVLDWQLQGLQHLRPAPTVGTYPARWHSDIDDDAPGEPGTLCFRFADVLYID
jgi:hypothetical protein